MPITAEVIEDSLNPAEIRLTTLKLVYPRFILAEVNTHRVFSRNSSSSRAVPIEKMIQRIEEDPAMPIHWGKNQKGMQANEELSGRDLLSAKKSWIGASKDAIKWAKHLSDAGVHKQVANRVLEPFMHMETLLSATEFYNWFELRHHADAQPEIQALAIAMKEAMDNSTPKQLNVEEWHLPFVSEEERETYDNKTLCKISTARCCRVSYYNLEGARDVEKDIALHERLVGSRPIHASPTEHLAWALDSEKWIKNFRGWVQYRVAVERLLKNG